MSEAWRETLQERFASEIGAVNARIDSLRIEFSDMRSENRLAHESVMSAMKSLEVNVAGLATQVLQEQKRQDMHDDWHGSNDERIGSRLKQLEDKDHDNAVRLSVWKSQGKWLMGGIAIGGTMAGVLVRFF